MRVATLLAVLLVLASVAHGAPTLSLGGPASLTFNVGTTSTVMLFAASPISITTPGLLLSASVVLGGLDGSAVEGLSASTVGTNITAQYTASSSTLALSGLSTAAAYATVLNTVSYFDFAVVVSVGPRSVQVTAVGQDTAVSNTVTLTASGVLCSTALVPTDLVFVLDSSLTVGTSNWAAVKQYAASIVKQLTVSATQTQYVEWCVMLMMCDVM